MVAVGVFSFGQIQARPMQRDTSKIGHKISNTAKKVGNATAHTAVSGESRVVDKVYDGKSGPDGQTVFINKHSHYYYVNKRGRRVYLAKSELKNKPE